MKIKNLLFQSAIFTFSLMGCQDNPEDSAPSYPAFLSVENEQVSSLNRIRFEEIYVPLNAWATVHLDSGNGDPMLSASLSYPKYLTAGTHQDESLIVFDSATAFSSPMPVWVILHKDNGKSREYEYNSSNGKLDQPLKLEGTNEILSAPVRITAPRIHAQDQVLSNNQLVVDSLLAGSDAWVVVHSESPKSDDFFQNTPEGVLRVPKGVHHDLKIQLDSAKQYPSGTQLYVVLCKDETKNGEWYAYDVLPELFGIDYIFSKVEVLP